MFFSTANNTYIVDRNLAKLEASIRQFEKWHCYLQLKSQIYLAYAYAFLGESLLAEDKCGDAVRTCREGISCFDTAIDYVHKYAQATGPGISHYWKSLSNSDACTSVVIWLFCAYFTAEKRIEKKKRHRNCQPFTDKLKTLRKTRNCYFNGKCCLFQQA